MIEPSLMDALNEPEISEPISVSVKEVKCSNCRAKSDQSVSIVSIDEISHLLTFSQDPVDISKNPNEILVGTFKCARCLKRNSLVLKEKERSIVENSVGKVLSKRRSSVRLVKADAQCWVCKEVAKEFISIVSESSLSQISYLVI
jgi:hypothetical protein